MTGPEDLAVRQARDELVRAELHARGAAEAASELISGGPNPKRDIDWASGAITVDWSAEEWEQVTSAAPLDDEPEVPLPCSWGDDAWHRAVSRLIRLHRPDYRRLLAQEQDRTEYTRAKMAAQEAGEQP